MLDKLMRNGRLPAQQPLEGFAPVNKNSKAAEATVSNDMNRKKNKIRCGERKEQGKVDESSLSRFRARPPAHTMRARHCWNRAVG